MTPPRTTLATLAAAAVLAAGSAVPAQATPPAGAPDCPTFPSTNVWHSDISRVPVHPRSAQWLASMGATTRRLHPDFGPSGDPANPYGIPYLAVAGSHAKVAVQFDYADESDPGPYPFGADTPIEGGRNSGGDMHAIVIDRDTCTLYETWYTHAYGPWQAGSGAVFDLRSNAMRPAGWTSADAAGLPIFPGLLRRDEVLAGRVDHAIRVTAQRTDRRYVWPARHQAGAANDETLPPMGARFRLKASYNIAGLRPDTQVALRAMKKHGLILADNGSNWYFQGTADNAWDGDFLDEIKGVPASAFEAVDASSLMIDPNSARARGTGGSLGQQPGNHPGPWIPRGVRPAPTKTPVPDTQAEATPLATSLCVAHGVITPCPTHKPPALVSLITRASASTTGTSGGSQATSYNSCTASQRNAACSLGCGSPRTIRASHTRSTAPPPTTSTSSPTRAPTSISTPISSAISRVSAASSLSPGSTLPPGNSHQPASSGGEPRWAASTSMYGDRPRRIAAPTTTAGWAGDMTWTMPGPGAGGRSDLGVAPGRAG